MRPTVRRPVIARSTSVAPLEPRAKGRSLTGARLDVHVTAADSHTLLQVRGEIDPSTAERFSRAIETALGHGAPLVIDLEQVSFMDSTGIAALVAGYQRAAEGPDAFVVRNPCGSVHRLLTICGLDEIMTIEAGTARTARLD